MANFERLKNFANVTAIHLNNIKQRFDILKTDMIYNSVFNSSDTPLEELPEYHNAFNNVRGFLNEKRHRLDIAVQTGLEQKSFRVYKEILRRPIEQK